MSTSPPASPCVLILGANGRLGQAATTAFASAGWRVVAQSRRPLAAPLPDGARHTAAALDATAELAAAAPGARAVVYAINPPYPRWARDALPLARQGMEVACRLDATFLFPGNVYNFGDQMPALLTEDTAQRPTTSFGRLRCQLEDELRARRDLRSVVIRAGDFFGTGRGAWVDLVITRALRKGKLVYPGPLDREHAWAYLPDLARTFVAAAEREELPPHARWHFAGYALTGAAWLDALEEAAVDLGVRPAGSFTRGGVPWPLLRIGGLVAPTWRAITELSYLWRVPHALDGRALEAELGPMPPTPLATALRATLADLGFQPTSGR